jgi:hypothetical protein
MKITFEIKRHLPNIISFEEGEEGFRAVFKKQNAPVFCIICSWGLGWEHVSVSIPSSSRCPTWEEMCYVKGLCWNEDETVIQYHPAKQDYVNYHPFVLHLWRPIGIELPKPPTIMIGPK